MYIIKVLKRKDAVSVIVSIVLGLVVAQLLPSLTSRLAQVLSGETVSSTTIGAGWQNQYLYPAVSAVLTVLALEVLLRVYVYAHNMMKK